MQALLELQRQRDSTRLGAARELPRRGGGSLGALPPPGAAQQPGSSGSGGAEPDQAHASLANGGGRSHSFSGAGSAVAPKILCPLCKHHASFLGC